MTNYSYPFRAMVVDDDAVTRHLLFRLLKQHGFQVFETSEYEIAIRSFVTLKPGIILLEQKLAGLSGLEIARFIRKLAGGEFVKIYLHTAYQQSELIAEPNYRYIDGYIEKGDSKRLLCVMREHCAMKNTTVTTPEVEINAD